MTISALAAGVAATGLGIHVLSALPCERALPRRQAGSAPSAQLAAGLDRTAVVRSRSRSRARRSPRFLSLDYPEYEIVFCLADAADPIAPLVRGSSPPIREIPARLLVGDDRVSGNPKLNNVVKGWHAARHDWIVIADSNVLMPQDYLRRLMSRWRSDTGIVCSPPIGSRPVGFAAELECAFLNTYQARWQYAGERVGYGFAQGKTMLWRRDVLDDGGGIEALGDEIAEDAASTKLVHRAGLRAHLVDRPFAQPLGARKYRDVWKRQLRWARLRRATFAVYFAPEIFTTSLFTMVAAALAAPQLGLHPVTGLMLAASIWYGTEALLAAVAGWPLVWRSPLAWIARDLLLPWLWVQGWTGDQFEWRGNPMTVGEEELAADGAGPLAGR